MKNKNGNEMLRVYLSQPFDFIVAAKDKRQARIVLPHCTEKCDRIKGIYATGKPRVVG